MPRRDVTSRRDLALISSQRKISTPTEQRVRVNTSPTFNETMRPRADDVEKRNEPLKPRDCNKARPDNNKSKGGGSRSFAGLYGKDCK